MKKKIFYFAVAMLSGVILVVYSCGKSYNAPAPAPGNNGVTASVNIQNMAFIPDTLRVKAGTTVTWSNMDGMTHTVTSSANLFDSGSLAAGHAFYYTFASAGTFNYVCVLHSGMKAVIIVN
jgi:plastocyanin